MHSFNLKSVLPVLGVAVLALLPMGCKKAPPITLSCNASAPTVYPGDPLTVTATAGSVDTEQEKQRPLQLERGRRNRQRHVGQRQYGFSGSGFLHREG